MQVLNLSITHTGKQTSPVSCFLVENSLRWRLGIAVHQDSESSCDVPDYPSTTQAAACGIISPAELPALTLTLALYLRIKPRILQLSSSAKDKKKKKIVTRNRLKSRDDFDNICLVFLQKSGMSREEHRDANSCSNDEDQNTGKIRLMIPLLSK